MSNTPSVYPTSIDDHLRIPLRPTVARLSEAESPEDYGLPEAKNENSHSDLHHAENNSIKMIERHALVDDSVSSHDHSDPYNVDYSSEYYQTHPTTKKGRRLRVQNTHVFTDNTNPNAIEAGPPDSSREVIHHTIGTGANQAAPGNLTNMVKALAQQVYYLEQILDRILPGQLIKSTISFDDLAEIQSANIGVLNTSYTIPDGNNIAIGNINVNSGNGYIKTHDGTSNNDVKVN